MSGYIASAMLAIACLLGGSLWLGASAAPPSAQNPPGQSAASGKAQSPMVAPEVLRTTITGEVIDVWCYCSRSVGIGRGEGHKKCAQECAAGGAALGILDDSGRVFIAAKTGGFKGANDMLAPYVAKRVTVKGWYATRGGAEVLKIVSVAPAASSPAKASSASSAAKAPSSDTSGKR